MNNQKFGKLSTQTLQSSLSNEFLQLIVLPTEQCNFRCSYCYEDFEIGRMSESVVTGIKNLLNKRVPELKGFQFMWFGGEPLAAKDIMIELARFARDLCARHGVHFASGDVTTNGYLLTPETVTDLLAANQNYFQVSLDGFGEVHNQTRKLMSGGGTFDRIWANLLAMKERTDRFGVTLRLHLTNANSKGNRNCVIELWKPLKETTDFEYSSSE